MQDRMPSRPWCTLNMFDNVYLNACFYNHLLVCISLLIIWHKSQRHTWWMFSTTMVFVLAGAFDLAAAYKILNNIQSGQLAVQNQQQYTGLYMHVHAHVCVCGSFFALFTGYNMWLLTHFLFVGNQCMNSSIVMTSKFSDITRFTYRVLFLEPQ